MQINFVRAMKKTMQEDFFFFNDLTLDTYSSEFW